MRQGLIPGFQHGWVLSIINAGEWTGNCRRRVKRIILRHGGMIMGNGAEDTVIRLLRADEIECRASMASEKGVGLLLYKDARVDQRILDETFGLFGWKRSHQCIDGNLYCTVEVYNKETGEWISKQDVGTNGYTEKEKSQASDSFKRACFNWGIGRELYTAPFIWIPAEKADIRKKGDKFYCSSRFSVNSIEYNGGREIVGLSIVDGNRRVVYELKGKTETGAGKAGQAVSDARMDSLEKELQRTGVKMEAVKDRYQIDNPMEMSEETYRKVMNALAKTKSKAA